MNRSDQRPPRKCEREQRVGQRWIVRNHDERCPRALQSVESQERPCLQGVRSYEVCMCTRSSPIRSNAAFYASR